MKSFYEINLSAKPSSDKKSKRLLIEVMIVYATFCLLSFVSRFIPSVFLLVLVFGIVLPLVWANRTEGIASLGFKQRNRKQALLWGLATGLIPSFYIISMFFIEKGDFSQSLLGLQLAFGIPAWLLIISPFQELFFRGWMQPRVQNATGKWIGLIITSICFTIWHLFPQFEGTSTSTIPIFSVISIITMFCFGMLWGYSFDRTKNIIAPWLAHAIAGIVTVAIGAMTFITYVP